MTLALTRLNQSILSQPKGETGESLVAPNWQVLVMLGSSAWPEASSRESTYLRLDGPHTSPARACQVPQWSENLGWICYLPAVEPMDSKLGIVQCDLGQVTTNLDTTVARAQAAEQAQIIGSRLNQQLAEAAHDIRAPLAVAQQILSSLTAHVGLKGHWEQDAVQLLEIAKQRLTQANNWAEGILVERSLGNGQTAQHRRRFYPQQWQAGIKTLLSSLAMQRHVQISWEGWDSSLPRLYLDPDYLSRAVLNLVTNAIAASGPDCHVTIRVNWQTHVTQHLVLTIEDQGNGLDLELMHKVNATELWPTSPGEPRMEGMGLKIAKSLIRAIGGAISAQYCRGHGTLFRLTLPVDNYHSLIRGWLLQNIRDAKLVPLCDFNSIEIHAIRSAKVDAGFIDSQLQMAAGRRELLYRVAHDRWLWLNLLADGRVSDCVAPGGIAGRLQDWSGQRARPICLEQKVFCLTPISLTNLHCVAQAQYRLPDVTNILAEKMAELIGDRIPPLDDLAAGSPSIVMRPLGQSSRHHSHSRHIRLDQAEGAQPRLGQTVERRVSSRSERPASPASNDQQPATTMLPESMLHKSLSVTLAEVAEQWYARQMQLDHARSKLFPQLPVAIAASASAPYACLPELIH